MQNYQSVPIASITIRKDRARALDKDWAKALAAMMADYGQKTAIEVYAEDDGYVLVAGLHRLEAARQLGWEKITANLIQATSEHEAAEYRLHEVLENVGRQELTVLDRAHHLHEYMQVMRTLYPELEHGGDRKSKEAQENQVAILATRSEILEKIGLSDRSIRRAVAIWEGLTKPTRQRAAGTWLADHQAGLTALAAVGEKQQGKILDVLFDDKLEPRSVAEAIEYLKHGRLADSAEKQIASLTGSLAKLDDNRLSNVLATQKPRVLAWAKKELGLE